VRPSDCFKLDPPSVGIAAIDDLFERLGVRLKPPDCLLGRRGLGSPRELGKTSKNAIYVAALFAVTFSGQWSQPR
jgi:hypothetical protein